MEEWETQLKFLKVKEGDIIRVSGDVHPEIVPSLYTIAETLNFTFIVASDPTIIFQLMNDLQLAKMGLKRMESVST